MDGKSSRNRKSVDKNSKNEQLNQYRVKNTGEAMTTNQGKKYRTMRTS
ncbi:hypothetical protein GCM10009001_35120 [Virgibacillus siamensis]|uniref:Uncharacterized protein n=1 Tax=Virgibacillus siamensis TaxID=480071 RepID=A0ABN1GMU4_9BACI